MNSGNTGLKSNIDFANLKSNFIIKKIFSIMGKAKSLEIMKYSKKLQKRFNLSIKDYKDYSQTYSPIEIELKLNDKKYGKFINISCKDYYHIYFDNSNEEIKRNYLKQNEKVDVIKIIIDYQVVSFEKLFKDNDCISSIFFKKFHRITITDMRCMFDGCSSLKELNLLKFNTDNVKNMSLMFYGCSSLKELNLSKFNTDNVTNMGNMFSKCSSLTKLNISNLN